MDGGGTLRRTGMAAAAASALFSILYVIAQILEWLALLGSAGGPDSASTPFGLAVLLLPSLLLGPAWLVLTAAVHRIAPSGRKVLSLSAFGFAVAYATLTGLVYFVQLTLVAPRLASGDTAGIELLLFVPYRSFLFAVDLFGYSLMCASTLFAGFALPDIGGAKGARSFLLLNGLLLPALAFQMLVPSLIWIAALWALFFPAAAILLYRMFDRAGRGEGRGV
jgi:hypothetical protein